MEILSAGSFINLENEEKIERLKNTAIELANAAALQTDDFADDTEAGRKLGLEFWQGLEYMCRDAEEGAIKNIFLTSFLERFKALRPTESVSKDFSPVEPKPKDEFLGVIREMPEETDEEIIAAETRAVIEGYSKFSDEQTQSSEADSGEIERSENAQSEHSGTAVEISPVTSEVETIAVSSEDKIELNETSAAEEEETNGLITENPHVKTEEKGASGAIILPEKEPYNFARCTVTATVQLLPASEGERVRKAVLSVRTHDFAPQISMVEIKAESPLVTELASHLERAFEKYKSDLPLRVMDKLKSEKNSRKKAVKTAAPPQVKASSAVNVSAPSESKQENADGTRKPSAQETGAKENVSQITAAATQTTQTGANQQGSLF